VQIVTAHRLKQWAETLPLDAQAELSELVRSLVRASCPDLEYYRQVGRRNFTSSRLQNRA
jgi:hypothetical protein